MAPNDGDRNDGKGWYVHDTVDNANLLKARVKARIASHKNDDNLYLAFQGKAIGLYPVRIRRQCDMHTKRHNDSCGRSSSIR